MALADKLLEEVDGKLLTAANDTTPACLAALYDETWKTNDPKKVFVRAKVERDEDNNVSVDVPKERTSLMWKAGEDPPKVFTNVFECRGMLIRDEYAYILKNIWDLVREADGHFFGYEEIKSYSNEYPPFNPFVNFKEKKSQYSKMPGVIVTGTPGIGKSMFLFYILALRLLAKKATVLHAAKDEFVVFLEDGVYQTRKFTDELASYLPTDTWFLFDSNDDVTSPPKLFFHKCRTNARLLIMAASPRLGRIEFSKEPRIRRLWMKPFDLSELVMARRLQSGEKYQTEKDLETFYYDYGPMSRAAFIWASKLDEYREKILGILKTATFESIEESARLAGAGYLEKGLTHKVLHAYPVGDNPKNYYIEIATQNLTEIVLMVLTEREARILTNSFLHSSHTRGVAGQLLESIALNALPKGGQWTVTQMTKGSAGTNDHWRSSEGDDSYTLRIGAGKTSFLSIQKGSRTPPRSFHSVNVMPFPSGTKPSFVTAFHVPQAQSHPTFDAYAYTKETTKKPASLVIFQVTCSESHNLNPQGFEWLGMEPADVVIVTSYDGGRDLYTTPEVAKKVANVYRFVFLPNDRAHFWSFSL